MSENTLWATFWTILGIFGVVVVGAITYGTLQGQTVELARMKAREQFQAACINAGGTLISGEHCIQQPPKSAAAPR